MPKVSYTKDAVKQAAAVRRAKPGLHAFAITNAQMHDSQNNDYIMQKLTLRILKDPRDPNSTVGPPVNNFVTLPLDNVDAGVPAPEYSFRMATNILSAAFPDEVPPMPYRVGGQLYYEGEEIDNAQEAACRHKSMLAACETSTGLVPPDGDPGHWIGKIVFAQLYYDEGSDFPSLRRFKAELPDNWELEAEHEEVFELDEGGGQKKAASTKKTSTRRTGGGGGRSRRRRS